MNIAEVESLTGLTRANVRFYEKKGLLNTIRMENGYRDYSEENVTTLLRIRLLREIGISLEDIRTVQENEAELTAILEKHLQELKSTQEKVLESVAICENIQASKLTYGDLDAKYYLTEFRETEKESTPARETRHQEVTMKDTPLAKVYPFRRYFARGIDMALYHLLFDVIWIILLKNKATSGVTYDTFVLISAFTFTLILEPLFLTFCSTTPGKWIFGIRITDNWGGTLSYAEAFRRTFSVLRYGEGFFIPIYSLYCNYKYYRRYKKDAFLSEIPWEEESEMVFKDDKNWRCFACAAVQVLLVICSLLCYSDAKLPRYRGDITPEEFAVNYNDYVILMEGYSASRLQLSDNIGHFTWTEEHLSPDETGYYEIYLGENPVPDWKYTEKDGILQSVSFEYDYKGSEIVSGFGNYMTEAVLSFVCTQDKYNAFTNSKLVELTEYILENSLTSFKLSDGDFTITYLVETEGYNTWSQGWVPEIQGANGTIHVTFFIERNEKVLG